MEFVFTGFQPFLDHTTNPSWDAAKAAAKAAGARAYELEVTFEAAQRDSKWLSQSGRAVIMFGLAASSPCVRFERFAHNLRADGPVSEASIEPGPELCRQTEFDTSRLAMLWNAGADELSLPVAALSRDAGNYVCNALYWHVLGHRSSLALFIHIPKVSTQVATQIGELASDLLNHVLMNAHSAEYDHVRIS